MDTHFIYGSHVFISDTITLNYLSWSPDLTTCAQAKARFSTKIFLNHLETKVKLASADSCKTMIRHFDKSETLVHHEATRGWGGTHTNDNIAPNYNEKSRDETPSLLNARRSRQGTGAQASR